MRFMHLYAWNYKIFLLWDFLFELSCGGCIAEGKQAPAIDLKPGCRRCPPAFNLPLRQQARKRKKASYSNTENTAESGPARSEPLAGPGKEKSLDGMKTRRFQIASARSSRQETGFRRNGSTESRSHACWRSAGSMIVFSLKTQIDK
jgi:hypothetical protein